MSTHTSAAQSRATSQEPQNADISRASSVDNDVLSEELQLLHTGFAKFDPTPLNGKYTGSEAPVSAAEHFAKSEFFAAIAATRKELSALDTESPLGESFDLWYIRIQSLLILQQGQQAAEEITRCLKVLERKTSLELTASERYKAWRLRILTVPVKSKGINQVAVQQYYNLASEARAAARVLPENSEQQKKWLSGIELAGQYALSTLIAIKDYDSAIQLLTTHYKVHPITFYATLLSLLYISIGDTLGATPWIEKVESESERNKLKELVVFADDDSRVPSSEIVMNGLEELYEGRVQDAITELEKKCVEERSPRNQLMVTSTLQNLALLYNLCYTDPETQYKKLRERLDQAGNTHVESTDPVVRRILRI